MSNEEIFEKLKGLIAEGLDVDVNTIKMESTFVDDLSADSLDVVELIMSIEEEFNVEISDERAEKIVTVSDAVDAISENIQ